jgi:hypothetical protein
MVAVYGVQTLLSIATTALGIGLECTPVVYRILRWCGKHRVYKVYMLLYSRGVWCMVYTYIIQSLLPP